MHELEIDTDKFVDNLHEFCQKNVIHEACLLCSKDCKQPYTRWSGCMPYSEYCKGYKESQLSKFITELVT